MTGIASVTGWALFWTICLVLALATFSLMAIVVTIGGAVDIRRLLRRLEREDPQAEDHR